MNLFHGVSNWLINALWAQNESNYTYFITRKE